MPGLFGPDYRIRPDKGSGPAAPSTRRGGRHEQGRVIRRPTVGSTTLKIARSSGNSTGEMEELQYLSNLGLGAVFGGVIFLIYRADRKHSEERYRRLASDFKEVIEQNTKAMTRLAERLGGPWQNPL